ncbi:MAG: hypothetical protein Q4D38_03060, partial [Planctomycetia bacterium]|nr:hypothetical protein [Planctomycetia bacterium]
MMSQYESLANAIQHVRAQAMQASHEDLERLARAYTYACQEITRRAKECCAALDAVGGKLQSDTLEEIRNIWTDYRVISTHATEDWMSILGYMDLAREATLPVEELVRLREVVLKYRKKAGKTKTDEKASQSSLHAASTPTDAQPSDSSVFGLSSLQLFTSQASSSHASSSSSTICPPTPPVPPPASPSV